MLDEEGTCQSMELAGGIARLAVYNSIPGTIPVMQYSLAMNAPHVMPAQQLNCATPMLHLHVSAANRMPRSTAFLQAAATLAFPAKSRLLGKRSVGRPLPKIRYGREEMREQVDAKLHIQGPRAELDSASMHSPRYSPDRCTFDARGSANKKKGLMCFKDVGTAGIFARRHSAVSH